MTPTESSIRDALRLIVDPHTGQDLVSAQAVRSIAVAGDRVLVDLQLGYPVERYAPRFARELEAKLSALPGVAAASVAISWRILAHRVQQGLAPVEGVRNILAVASGKGGVGKSTTAVNLALALRAEGARVGILDADIYGPSQPLMTGQSGMPQSTVGNKLIPKTNLGLQVMSIGFLLGDDQPVIWRGPLVTRALLQMLTETVWDNLDYLVIDLPPGTGDIHLTLCQRVPVSGALIVTTPQDIALADARKALRMFEEVKVPVIGIVENMSVFCCPSCGHVEPIFGSGGGAKIAAQYGVELLSQMPLDSRIREEADSGVPTVVAEPDSPLTEIYLDLARKTAGRLSTQARNKAISFPQIVIQQS
ncbi:MAG: iron-sulfur cluster carrier protein ApbC [Xanthomonadales bacterium]|jgi:ATP-binding protein involved in chromosome partitioning|nr:iron-sulfur cluster carrier protein ApbC [Xanthomonadales bacterium]